MLAANKTKISSLLLLALIAGCATPEQRKPDEKKSTSTSRASEQLVEPTTLPIEPLAAGSASNLDEYLGNGSWTLVMFWSSVMHITMFEEVLALHQEIDESMLSIVGISIDPANKINKKRQDRFLSEAKFPNYRGDHGEIFQLYQRIAERPFRGTPSFILFNRQGKPAAADEGVLKRAKIKEFIDKNE